MFRSPGQNIARRLHQLEPTQRGVLRLWRYLNARRWTKSKTGLL